MKSEFVFDFDRRHNHAPSIVELKNGDLLVSWYRGSGERQADDVAVWGARSKAGTSQWSDAFVMADTPGFPDCNTAMMTNSEGELFLFWPVILANSWESCLTRIRVSRNPIGKGSPAWDRDETILLKPDDFGARARQRLDKLVASSPRPLTQREQDEIELVQTRLGDRLYQRLGWQPRCKPTVLPSGRILLPLYSDTFSLSLMAISDDRGLTWRAGQPMLGFGAIQPSVLRRRDGTLVAYMRENGVTGRVRVAESIDEGESWGDVGITSLPNPGSGLDGLALRDGRWLLVHNDTSDGRHQLAVSASRDEGRTWTTIRYLEKHSTGQYHYPAIIQTQDKRIHVVYSYFVDAGKTIKHVSFSPAWLDASADR